MPNHVTHRVICTGTVEDVAAFKQLMITPNEEDSSDGNLLFNFDRIVPQPEILKNTVATFKAGRAQFYLKDGTYNTRDATDEEQAELDRIGFSNWYDFNVSRWGSKWNSYSFGEITNQATYEFGFDTAWSPPEPVFDKLMERFPNLNFEVAWFDEGWCHAGEGKIGRDYPGANFDTIAVEPNNATYERIYGEFPIDWEQEEWSVSQSYAQNQWDTDRENHIRRADNFICHDVAAASDTDGYYTLSGTMLTSDFGMYDDELYALRRIRQAILL